MSLRSKRVILALAVTFGFLVTATGCGPKSTSTVCVITPATPNKKAPPTTIKKCNTKHY